MQIHWLSQLLKKTKQKKPATQDVGGAPAVSWSFKALTASDLDVLWLNSILSATCGSDWKHTVVCLFACRPQAAHCVCWLAPFRVAKRHVAQGGSIWVARFQFCFFCCCCYWHPDTQWPAGWSLVALSFLMEQSDKQRTVRTSASPRGKVTLSRSHQMCPQGLFMKSILNTSVQSVCLILSAALRNENSHNSVFKWSHIGKMKENYFFWQKYLSLMKKVCLLCCLLHLCALTMQWIKVEFSSWWCHKMHAPWCSFRSLKLPHNQLDLVSFQNNLDRSRQASVFAEWFCSRL